MTKLLIAENQQDIAGMLETQPGAADFQILCCTDGASVLKLADEEKPDLVIVDAELPAVDGLEALRRWRSKRATFQLPVIVLTNRIDNYPYEVAMGLRVNDYFVRPVDPGRLVASIRKILKMPMAA